MYIPESGIAADVLIKHYKFIVELLKDNECYLMSEDVLTKGWDAPEEDEAWDLSQFKDL